jgi:ribosomal protein S27E
MPGWGSARKVIMASMARAAVTRKVMVAVPVMTFHRVVCPACGVVQGAAVVYSVTRTPWRRYECRFCGEAVDEERWQEVEDEG